MMLTYDVEAGGGSNGHALDPNAFMLCVVWQEDDGPLSYSWFDDRGEYPRDLARAIQRATELCAHNGKYELHWMRRHGIDVRGKVLHDTMLREWVILGNNPDKLEIGLEACGSRYIPDYAGKDAFVDYLLTNDVPAEEIPDTYLLERCCTDVETTRSVYLAQERVMSKPMHVLALQHACMSLVLTDMERSGLYLNEQEMREGLRQVTDELQALHVRMHELCGVTVNPRLVDQMAYLLYGIKPAIPKKVKKGEEGADLLDSIKPLNFKEAKDSRGKPTKAWPNGRPKIGKEIFEGLADKATTKRQTLFVELRNEIVKRESLISKTYDYFRTVCDSHGGKFHPDYRQGTVDTHRLSATGRRLWMAERKKWLSLQAQNVPRGLKRLQIPPPGYLTWEADCTQVEFRNAAALAHDMVAMKDIDDPSFDAHLKTLQVMTDGAFDQTRYDALRDIYLSGEDEELDEKRSKSKAKTFKPLFGGEYGTPEEMAYYAYFHDRYKKIRAWQQANIATVARTGKLECVGGLTLRFNTSTNKYGSLVNAKTGKQLAPSICNYPVQFFSTACVAVPSILSLASQVEDFNESARLAMDEEEPLILLAGTTHDSVFGYIKERAVPYLARMVERAFIEDCYETIKNRFCFDYTAPLGVELKVGRYLGDKSILHHKASRRPGV